MNIIDDFNRVTLWIEVDTLLPAAGVIRLSDQLAAWHGYPEQLRMVNSPELISVALATWAAQHNVHLVHIQTGQHLQRGPDHGRRSAEIVFNTRRIGVLGEIVLPKDFVDEAGVGLPVVLHQRLG